MLLVADVDDFVVLLNEEDVLNSYFNTIEVNLCKNKCEYPLVLEELFLKRKLKIADVPQAKQELLNIKEKLQQLFFSHFVYDKGNSFAYPSEDKIYNKNAKNLYDYFINVDNHNLTEVFIKRCDKALKFNWDIIIYPMLSHPDERPKADQAIKK